MEQTCLEASLIQKAQNGTLAIKDAAILTVKVNMDGGNYWREIRQDMFMLRPQCQAWTPNPVQNI